MGEERRRRGGRKEGGEREGGGNTFSNVANIMSPSCRGSNMADEAK